ncbi:MAG: hypothetical protein ACE5FQ_14860, partial [Thiogranum sp.]
MELAKMFSVHDNGAYPYTYQAVVKLLDEDDSIRVSYFADTICGLVEFLRQRGEDPGRTEILEIYREQETTVPARCYLGDDGRWLCRAELCYPMTTR